MLGRKLSYWLPRIFVIGFALSLLLPAPDFVTGMSEDAFVVWLVRVAWVVGLPLAFCLVLAVVAWVGKRTARGSH